MEDSTLSSPTNGGMNRAALPMHNAQSPLPLSLWPEEGDGVSDAVLSDATAIFFQEFSVNSTHLSRDSKRLEICRIFLSLTILYSPSQAQVNVV